MMHSISLYVSRSILHVIPLPKDTEVLSIADEKPEPFIVTRLPPLRDPLFGETSVTLGRRVNVVPETPDVGRSAALP